MDLIYYSFIAAFSIQMLFWGIIFARLALYRKRAQIDITDEPVSVIICAKNEAENLSSYLPLILAQEYPDFEVLVVDDGSSDRTAAVLAEMSTKHPQLRVLTLREADKEGKGKKWALSQGIAAAQHENLLLTDADCYPSSPHWIAWMMSELKGDVKIVLGYGPYTDQSGFLNKFIQYETTHVAIQYLSFALWGFPYMGVGRNLLYKKSLYIESQGFDAHKHIASGDDDLFINAASSSKNTHICLNNQAFMYSAANTIYKNYYVQKTRHFSSSKHYKIGHILVLSIYSASHIGIFFFFLTAVIFNIYGTTVLLLMLARMILLFITYGNVLKRLNHHNLFLWIPLLDVLYVMYYFLFTPAVLRNKSRQWK